MDKKSLIYFLLILIGIATIIVGLLINQILRFLMPINVMITRYDWIIIIGIIFTILSLILLFSKKIRVFQNHITLSTLEIVLIAILIILSAGSMGWLYGQYQKTLLISTENIQRIDEQLKMWDQMETSSPFYCKKVIIRDDDIGNASYLQSVRWISNLCVKKDIKVTFAVIPAMLINNSETINYLNQLDRYYFEFAMHGYEHTRFQGVSYSEQYSLIENGTRIIEEYLNHKPTTFIPPHGSGDVNTTKVLRLLEYHSITDMIGYPSYVVNFKSDLAYDIEYNPPRHQSLEEFKCSFDNFYNSSDEYYVVFLHDWTFLNDEGELDEVSTYEFEQGIDHIKSYNVQFMTIEESYQWFVDETRIRTGMVNDSSYFIDLRNCIYNHTIKFSSPSGWDEDICIQDGTTGEKTVFSQDVFEFEGMKGHLYELVSGGI